MPDWPSGSEAGASDSIRFAAFAISGPIPSGVETSHLCFSEIFSCDLLEGILVNNGVGIHFPRHNEDFPAFA